MGDEGRGEAHGEAETFEGGEWGQFPLDPHTLWLPFIPFHSLFIPLLPISLTSSGNLDFFLIFTLFNLSMHSIPVHCGQRAGIRDSSIVAATMLENFFAFFIDHRDVLNTAELDGCAVGFKLLFVAVNKVDSLDSFLAPSPSPSSASG